jgi:hypothetical protein
MDRTALGYSVRVGCQVQYTTRTHPGNADIIEIQYYENKNHGPDAQARFAGHYGLEHSLEYFIDMLADGVLWLIQEGPDLGHTSHRISESLRLRVQINILRGLTNADIVQQNRDEFLNAYMSQQDGNVTDRILAAAQLAESKPPKDYFLNSTDVANIRRLLDKRDWLFSENPQESVVMWASQNEADVTLSSRSQFQEHRTTRF